MGKPKLKLKIPPQGERIQIYTLPKEPEDFNKFLDDFSDNFEDNQFAMAIKGGGKMKPKRVKEKESDEKLKREEKFGHGIKAKTEESYIKRKAKFKFEIMNVELLVKFEFEGLDAYFKYKVKGGGLISKMIGKLLSKAAGAMFVQGGIDSIEKALK
jgi:hypothetical protein